ncbi:MBG domain-containing protein [Pedobacter roseus]|uniref:IPT/TIG domain-containing protein n=1 Tax=Pedobacter roseus TaxID=336820 RepID=A0A7G9QKA1_9SPHI|nr:MBG domain-containing protein [Pedobacter roseus]QNN43776.1 IPT/TIG domain-containing protein [Pedobacter roseus]
MKKALLALFSTAVLLLVALTVSAQIQFKDTYEQSHGNTTTTLTVSSTSSGRNVYLGTSTGSSTTYRIIYTGTRWEVQVDIGGSYATAYYNTTATTPDPPALGNGTWQSTSPPDQITVFTGNVISASSNDATLSALSISAGTLTPAFSSSGITYSASVTNGTSSINITPTRNQANATIKINGTTATSGSPFSVNLSVGNNAITVLVTAQDGTTTKTYTINVGRALPVPTVTALSPTSGPASGGTSVTITGTNFSGATAVTFGATAATGFTVNSATQITATAPAGTGTVDVRITTTGGTSATSASDQFTYIAAPTVTALSPISGPTSGGTSVTITGTNFSGATAVTFGATAATGFTVNSATQITATAPAGTGTVDVRITTTGGTSATSASDQFTYIAAPTVTALSPTSGPTSGGTSVTITGTNFTGATAVTFGATAATGFTVNSATQITATAPAGTGTVDVRITTTGGTSATSASDQFTYIAAPTVTALSPTGGPTSGGTSVTITGSNFSGATAVTFGATAAAGFTVNSATQITATAPAGTGTVDVRITTAGGTSATSASDQFTYIAAPTVTALSPTSGPTSGGTSVTITGTNFTGATAVTFGATAAAGFTVNSATQITATAPAGTGTVDVRITTAGGTSATSASDQFTYIAAPTVTALSPTSGPTSGGTSVTITGTNFTGATAVTFGATAAAGFTVNSATQITATAPAGTGTVDVRITTAGGTSATSASDQFTYIAAPTVTALSPISGPTSGGTSVTITGTNFTGATAVTFGATAATGFTVNSATQITATAPAGTGTVDVRITTTGGTSATSASDQFTYIAAPTVTALSPTSGPTSGGTSVTITGTNFSGATAVTFGATAATGFTVNSATQITATAPAGTGTVDVRITTTGGTSATSASDQFTYIAAPTVTALSPTSGPTSGGTSVTITGTNFTGATAVRFGATAATGFTVNSATQITATAPAGTGTVDVRITTTGGTSATSASDQFTYLAAPTVTALSPTSGPASGGTSVTITGTNFSGATAVTFGATAATGFTVNSATQITATAPAGTGTVDVRITTTGGTSATSASDQFTYLAAPTVTALSPTSGPASGGTSVTITGTNFSGATAVRYGATAATGFTVNSATQITATAPAGTGTVDVRITTAGGTSATSASDQFTYIAAPTVTAAKINISGGSGTGGAFKIGDVVTAIWDNSAIGDNNSGIIAVTIDFSQFGGGATVTASNNNDIWTATYTIVAGTIDATNRNISVTATNSAGPTTTTGTNNAIVDNVAPLVTDANISINGASGTGGTYKIGDVITATWNNTAAGDNNTDIISSVTINFSQFGSGSAVAATNSSGTWTATYTIAAGAINATNRNVAVTATDNAGNTKTTVGSSNATIDNQAPLVVISSTAGASGGSTGTSPIPFTVTFSESVTGFVAGGITPGNATLSGFSGSGTTYTFNATPTANGAVTMNIAANVAQDAAGNGNTAASQYSITYTQPSLITASAGTFPSALSTTYGTASASTSVSVSGTGLSAGITATPSSSTNFEVSADNVSYSSSVTIGSSGTVSGTVYVRLKANAPVGTNISGNVVLTSSNANSPTVSIPSSIVAKATLTYTANTSSKVYGDAVPALSGTVTGFVNSETISTATTGTLSWSTLASANSPAGSYGINGTGLSANNYDFVQASSNATALIVTTKTITVTAAAKSKTYGDADPALTYTSAPALVTGDTFTGSLTRAPGENVGAYAINQGTLALNTNYTLTYVGADLTISSKTITVTAAAKSKTYGDADPALTYTSAPALVGTDTFTGSLTRAPGENVGAYAINQGTLALNPNYTLTYVGADLTIGKKTITVTAVAKSKTYGDADPVLTYTSAPALVTGDSFTGSLTRVVGENVGAYAINQGTLALNPNYTLTYVGADLTIGKKTITVTAVAKSKTYGDADPTLTYTSAPALVTGDSFTGSLTRVVGENVGAYAINQGTLALNPNYTLTYVGADLTIGKKTITVTAVAKSKTYGDADPTLTYTSAPALVTGDSFTGSLTRAAGENVGTYAINQGTLALSPNYTLTYVGANLTIGAKTITVTAAAKSKTYGDVDPTLTYTSTPALVGTDTFAGSLTRAAGENVGAYAINQGTLALSPNYTLTYVGADLTIGAKTITVTAAAKSKTYGDADPALTYTSAPALVGTDTFTGSLTRSAGENVGTYAINQGTLALNTNYTLTYVGADLTIGKKAITVTAAAKSKTYGDADPALTYTSAPALVGTDTFTGSLTRAPGENVGAYAINQGTLALSPNYTLTYVGADLTIGKKTITVTAVAKSKTYGDADPVLTYTSAPALVTGDSFTGSLTRVVGDNVGTYAINQGTLALSPNYTLTYVGADLTIGKKTITVTAAAKSKTYGDVDPTLTYTSAPALVGTDTFTGSLTRATGENVGAYAINQGTLALNPNYTLTYVGADLTIGKKTITVTAAAKSKTYGDADPALTYTSAPALVGTDTFTGSLTRAAGENVGTYAINQGTLALSPNYTLTYVGADLTIGKKTITVTAAAKSKTYGDADPALTYTSAPALVGTDSFTGSLTRAAGENVGTYAINQGTLALNANYTLTYVGADLTIGKKTITVTAAAKSKTYGDADPALTYTSAPALVGTDTFTGSLTRAVGENVGTYAINQGTLALNPNYTLTYVGADLTIGKKTITVTAAAKSKTYGDVDPTLTYTSAPALVGTDSFTGSLTRVVGENVGTYAINQGTLALNTNYTLTYVGADLTIGKKTITVTAAAKSKTYGDANPVLTYTSAPALITGDSFSGSLTRTPGENVGTYAINQGTLALNANYTLTYVGADLTIGKKTITVTAAAKSKTYGDVDPALTYTSAPALVGTDSFAGSLTRAAGENIGTYAINQGTLALSPNYTLTYVGADLTIGKKTITVTAAAKSKTYGDADPALTYTSAPALVGTDTFTGSLTRAAGENVGAYAINQGTLALNPNYTLTYIGANLTIDKKTITVTAAAKSKTYGDADPALTYTSAPALIIGDTFTGSLTRAAGENVGTYAINQGTLALNANYTLTYVGANLTIGAKTITVTAAAKSKTYGDVDPALTYTFSPALQTGDSFSGSLTRAAGENAGTYAINQGTVTLSGNYAITYLSANLTINKTVLTVTASNASMCQSDGFPTFGVSYSGFKVGDTETALSTKPTVSTTANRNVAGTYTLVPAGGVANNYSFVYVNGTLTINALPTVNIVSNKGTDLSKGETAALTASGGTSYSWSTASGIISGQNTATLTVRPAQTTTYTVRVTNANGCSSIGSITIKVAEDYKIVANNILTPNGDGVNDTWIVQNIDMYPGNEVRIFDRNGRLMYNKKGYDNSWNGTIGGNDLAEGTYYYIITYGPDKLVQKGFITIIRNR